MNPLKEMFLKYHPSGPGSTVQVPTSDDDEAYEAYQLEFDEVLNSSSADDIKEFLDWDRQPDT